MPAEAKAAGIEGTSIGGFRLLTAFATDDIVRTLQACLTMSVLLTLFLIGFAFQSFRTAERAIDFGGGA